MANFQSSILVFVAHIILLLGLPTALVGAVPVTPNTRELAISGRSSSTYWVGDIKRQGTAPFGHGSDYKVYRNVMDFGAKGDGSTDDTAAINKAISSGNRCGKDCDSSTTTPALVYFPPGTYVVSKPIVQYYYTQIVGDAVDLPVIKASADFAGMAVIDADPYNDDGSNWYTNQNNFFRAVRNLVIDLTAMPKGSGAGIHWQVGQATSLQNIRFEMIKGGGAANKQQGIFMDNGSGGFMSDLTFNGGNYGMFLGNQQFTTRNLKFNGCQTAIFMNWNWAWTFKSLEINNCEVGLNMSTSPSNQTVGSVMMLDSKLTNTPIGIVTAWSKASIPIGGGTLILDNVDFSGSTTAVEDIDGSSLLAGGSTVANWVQGNTYAPSSAANKRAYTLDQEDDSDTVTIVETVVQTVQACPASDSGSVASTLATNAPAHSVGSSTEARITPALPTDSDTAYRSIVSNTDVTGLPGFDNSWLSIFEGSSDSVEVPVPSSMVDTSGSTAEAASVPAATSSAVPAATSSAVPAEVSSPAPSEAPLTQTPSQSESTLAPATVSSTSSAPASQSSDTTSGSSSSSEGTCSANQAISKGRTQSTMKSQSMPSSLLKDGAVFEKSKPLYADLPASSFISVKSAGAKGDGTTDDTEALQKVLDSATADQVVYFDHGAYVITDTLKVPKNIKITGEVWPMIMAHGDKFQNAKEPVAAMQIGQKGDVGSVEMSDLVITTKGSCRGAILMEWNVAAETQGSAGMWDVHIRIGGSAGTELQSDTCKKTPDVKTRPKAECIAAFMLLHVTEKASAYLENTWMWTADHELDLSDHSQVDIYTGRGILIESQGPVWLWGTASEHHQLYNYQVSSAKDVFMGLIQSETPYYQSNPSALTPLHPPTCTTASCRKSWGLRVLNSSDLFVYGAGLYSFFENYAQTCLNTEDCQENMVEVDCSDVHIYGLSTKAAVNMVTSSSGKSMVLEKDNTSNFCSTIALFEQTI
ncbi:hypothetical protein N7448_007609 [Penicillium atrosanguineum]|nr:hypothetical protein N7448_007609 [Penicillium atrosanguineum]